MVHLRLYVICRWGSYISYTSQSIWLECIHQIFFYLSSPLSFLNQLFFFTVFFCSSYLFSPCHNLCSLCMILAWICWISSSYADDAQCYLYFLPLRQRFTNMSRTLTPKTSFFLNKSQLNGISLVYHDNHLAAL